MTNLKSYKVFSKKLGRQFATLIISDQYTIKELNRLVQNGMDAVIIDERSMLVKGVNYDT